jgi:succinylarginine dihydrolase
MADFDKYFDKLLKNLEDLVKNNWKNFLDAAEADGRAFLLESKEDLKRWTRLLANGHITREEFELLVGSKEDLLKLKALKKLGLTKVRIQMFQSAVIGLIIDTAFDFFI